VCPVFCVLAHSGTKQQRQFGHHTDTKKPPAELMFRGVCYVADLAWCFGCGDRI
jgi:hypothetical protein